MRCLLSGHLFTLELIADSFEVRVGASVARVPRMPRRAVRLCERYGRPDSPATEKVTIGVGFAEV